MAIDYQMIDAQGAFINQSNPYTREFFTLNASATDTAYLTLSVLTGYVVNQASESAQILINGVSVGFIPPTYLSAATYNPYQGADLTLPFPNSLLAAPILPPFGVGFNSLQIVTQGDVNDPYNWVIVTVVICTYKQA